MMMMVTVNIVTSCGSLRFRSKRSKFQALVLERATRAPLCLSVRWVFKPCGFQCLACACLTANNLGKGARQKTGLGVWQLASR
jgi:hypothetical protein